MEWPIRGVCHISSFSLSPLLFVAVFLSACGSGSTPMASSMPVETAPAITMQPANQSVPMGLSAVFSVSATGPALQFQWSKNNSPIAGATASTYVTPATAFADRDASFTVTVSNSAGTVLSAAAALMVTARAPMAGDLRFQQVDAGATVNGWGNAGTGLSTFLIARGVQFFSPSLGTPFYVGEGNCTVPPVTNGTGCAWAYTELPFVPTGSSPTLIAAYGSDEYADLQADLADPDWPPPNNGVTPSSTAAVITSLDLEQASVLFAVSWTQSTQPTAFDRHMSSVTPQNLQAAASQEGAAGRVITAVSDDNGQVVYLSYGWQSDTATLYEAQVVTADPSGAVAAASNLAAQGYIITASGREDDAGDVILVGTRVQGDTLPRPFVAAQGDLQGQMMEQQGYANVAVIVSLGQSSTANPYYYLYER
jgi:hypothetical protein